MNIFAIILARIDFREPFSIEQLVETSSHDISGEPSGEVLGCHRSLLVINYSDQLAKAQFRDEGDVPREELTESIFIRHD